MVPRDGLEPSRTKVHRILSPACLPIPPPRLQLTILLLICLTIKEQGILYHKNSLNIVLLAKLIFVI